MGRGEGLPQLARVSQVSAPLRAASGVRACGLRRRWVFYSAIDQHRGEDGGRIYEERRGYY